MVPYTVVIPAAGRGTRMGADSNKLMLTLRNKPIIVWTVEAFAKDDWCQRIVLAIRLEERAWFEKALQQIDLPITYVIGGGERQQSVHAGLRAVSSDEVVLIHDGARPFVQVEHLHQVAEVAQAEGAILAVPVKDTVKQIKDAHITKTVPRADLWLAQTPQAFLAKTILAAHERAAESDYSGTDDASLLEWNGETVRIIPGDYRNIKITTPEDLLFGEAILAKEGK